MCERTTMLLVFATQVGDGGLFIGEDTSREKRLYEKINSYKGIETVIREEKRLQDDKPLSEKRRKVVIR